MSPVRWWGGEVSQTGLARLGDSIPLEVNNAEEALYHDDHHQPAHRQLIRRRRPPHTIGTTSCIEPNTDALPVTGSH